MTPAELYALCAQRNFARGFYAYNIHNFKGCKVTEDAIHWHLRKRGYSGSVRKVEDLTKED